MRIAIREGVNVLEKTILWGGVAVGAALLLAAVATPVFAADAEPPSVEADDAPVRLEEVVVTGSRIHMPNLSSASPIYHIDSEALSFQGNVRVEDTLRILPQVFSSQNANIANGATGTATLNLRNLGIEADVGADQRPAPSGRLTAPGRDRCRYQPDPRLVDQKRRGADRRLLGDLRGRCGGRGDQLPDGR